MDYAGNYSLESSHCVSERQMGRRANTNITVLESLGKMTGIVLVTNQVLKKWQKWREFKK